MKSLTNYIEEKLVIFHPQVDEKLVVNKNYDSYQYHPKTCKELRQLIIDRYEEQGPGTEQEPIDLNDIDVSRIDTFNNHTENCGLFEYSKFEYIDVSDWNVSNVTNMQRMFYMCKQLKSIDISNWNVSKVENVGYMFSSCINLESIGDISDWDVSSINNMMNMFCNCHKLESVGNLSKWNVSKVKDISFMFYNCEQLESVGDLSNWNISNVESNYVAFDGSGIINKPDWYKG